MADDAKRPHNVCVKVSDRVLIDLGRVCAIEDRSMSEFLYALIRRDLYGRSLRSDELAERITAASD